MGGLQELLPRVMYEEWKKQKFGAWYSKLKPFLMSEEFDTYLRFLKSEYNQYLIAPKKNDLFKQYRMLTPLRVRTCIVGQDPYPQFRNGEMVASGIPFGTELASYQPQSLRNIMKTIIIAQYHTNNPEPKDYFNDYTLEGWTSQGVLLLNAVPTIRIDGKTEHHDPIFNRRVIDTTRLTGETIALLRNVVIVLLGSVAHGLIKYIHESCEYLTLSHPSSKSYKKTDSPLWGSGFSEIINAQLQEVGNKPINWII